MLIVLIDMTSMNMNTIILMIAPISISGILPVSHLVIIPFIKFAASVFWFRIAFRYRTVILGFRIALGLWTMWITFGLGLMLFRLRTMWITFGLGLMLFRLRTMWITFGLGLMLLRLRTMWITFGLGLMLLRLRFVVPWMQDLVPVFQFLKSWKMFVIGLFFAFYCNYICKFK
jgi:hypothetical protein